MPYPFLADDAEETYGAMRVTLPNRYCDPKIAHDLYNRYLDEYEYADELGLEIMLNEHHATATCMAANVSITAGTLVRRTKRARLLVLGFPLAHRSPIQVAEDAAMLDVISGGRLIAGFVRGVGTEIHPANTNPSDTRETDAGGPRPHHQGVEDPGRVQLGGQALPLPLREPVAAALPATPSPHLDHRQPTGGGAMGGGPPLYPGHRPHLLRADRGPLRRLPQAMRGDELPRARLRQVRLLRP